MRIATNLSFMLLALAAGVVALPAPAPVKPEVRALVNGVSFHTFSPPFFVLLCPHLSVVTHIFTLSCFWCGP